VVPLFVGLVERGLRWCGEEDIIIVKGGGDHKCF
jgi:hypothetical protein